MYDQLLARLRAIQGLPVAEYEWATRPAGNHLTVQIDFAADGDNGDDLHQGQAYEGSIDLYTKGSAGTIAAAVEAALEAICEGAWHLNVQRHDRETGLIHREYVFQIEAI